MGKAKESKSKLLSSNIEPRLLMDYITFSKLTHDITDNLRVTYIVNEVLIDSEKEKYFDPEIVYICDVECTLNDEKIGSFRKRYLKFHPGATKKVGEIEHQCDQALLMELEELVRQSKEARKAIIEQFKITPASFNNILKEKALSEIKANLEDTNEMLQKLYKEREELNKNIEILEAEEAKYIEEMKEVNEGYQKRIEK